MSDKSTTESITQVTNEEEVEPGIRNDLHTSKTSIVKIPPTDEFGAITESEKWRIAVKQDELNLQAKRIALAVADRAEKYERQNSKSVDPKQQKRFEKCFDEFYKKELLPLAFLHTLEKSGAYSFKTGFSSTEMALALKKKKEYANFTLPQLKALIKNWRYRANEKLSGRIHPTKRDGVIRYHILTQKRDGDSQVEGLKDFRDMLEGARANREELTKQVVKERKKPQEILVDATGESVMADDDNQEQGTQEVNEDDEPQADEE